MHDSMISRDGFVIIRLVVEEFHCCFVDEVFEEISLRDLKIGRSAWDPRVRVGKGFM